jgi:hypothetical protein
MYICKLSIRNWHNREVLMKRFTAVVMIMLAYVLGVASPYIISNAIGWALFGSGSGHEMSRKTSPDGVLDAVVIENDPGAMSSFIYYLYLVPKGEKVSSHSDPYIVNTSEGEELKTNWQKPHFLEVSAGDSHIKWFANLWYSKRVPNYYVELKLTTGDEDYLRPDGRLRTAP